MRLIDADGLKEWVKNWFEVNRMYHPFSKQNNIPIPELYDILDRMPTIEPKKGKWILPNNPIAKANDEWICSGCHYLIGGKHNYCPNCGADMRDEGHETD